MKLITHRIFKFCLIFYVSLFFGQNIKNICPNELSFFASSLPIEGADWYFPIMYYVNNDLIDLKIKRDENSNEEVFIRFKIIEITHCNFINDGNLNIIYKVLTFDEEKKNYENKISEIQFKFSNCKGKIYIRHPNFSVIESDAVVY